MSVTFTADYRPASAFAASCGCWPATELAVRHRTYEQALAEVLDAPAERDALPGCEMPDICPQYPLYVHDADPEAYAPEVNVSVRNAVRLAHLLGFGALDPAGTAVASAPGAGDTTSAADREPATGDAGQMPAEQFLGRVLAALALTPEDAGVDGYFRGRWYTGGRRAGYLQQRLLELHALALWCAARGRDVAWG